MTSLAKVLPPGLSMRSTTAFTSSSKRASRNWPASVSEPMVPGCCSPGTISPAATMTAILSTGLLDSAFEEFTFARYDHWSTPLYECASSSVPVISARRSSTR